MRSTLLQQSASEVFPVSSVSTISQPQTSLVEQELLCPLPRRAHLTSATRTFHRLLWNLCIGTFLILFFFARRDIETWDALLRQGQVAQAEVMFKHISASGGNLTFYLNYGFYVQGRYCYGETPVSESRYYKTEAGDPLPVTYLPGTKNIWQAGQINTKQRNRRLTIWIVWTFAATGLMGTILTSFIVNAKKQLWLLQNGIPATATITRIELTNANTTSELISYRVTYRYKVPHRHKAGYRSLEDTIYVKPEVAEKYKRDGSYLSVLYDAQDPTKSLAYSQITAARLDAVTNS